ncbi:hypothetical protein C8R45DRAFT_942353 [Mycena sanguinolenta]|nr:hypothetical protein C8R45DRAFT_942353 [Mycena sanguinolenta]
MSLTRSLDASTSQPSPKGGGARWKPFKSQSSNHGNSIPPTIVNNYISGGHGGGGGQGGVHRGGGGSGEGPTLHYEINGENITMNMVQSPNVVQASSQFFFVQDTQKQRIYVLYGLGGAGKTQIALKFIEESNCTTETIQNGLRHIATAKGAGTTSQDALAWLAWRLATVL